MSDQRQFFRIAVERPGRLRHGHESVECEVLDLTEKGLQLRTPAAIRVGEMVQLDWQLDDQELLRCALVITYSRPPYVGGRIVSISQEDHRRLSRYVEQHIVSQLVGI